MQAAARAAGRPPDAVTGAAYVTLALDPSPAAAEQRLHRLHRDVLRRARARDPRPPGRLRRLLEGGAEWLQRWIDAGVRHFCLRFAGGDQLAQVDEAASRLLPRLRRG